MVGRMMVVAMIAAVVACGTSSKPAGAVCTDSSECEATDSCLELGQFSGSACTVVGKVCSKNCTTNSDCAELGAGFMCFASCGSAMVCGATAP